MHSEQVRPLIEAVQALEMQAQRAAVGEPLRLLAARTSRQEMQGRTLPEGMRISPHKLRGQRISVKRSPSPEHTVATAYWPKDGLEETRFPILCCVLHGTTTLPLGDYQIHADANNFVFIPPSIPHPDGSRPHLHSQSEDEFCDLFWLYRWEGGLICHICHSRGPLHANFEASENCFITGSQSMQFFDLLTDAVTTESSLVRYLLPALLAAVGHDLQAGRFVQIGTHEREETSSTREEHLTTSVDVFKTILRIQNYMTFHLDRPLSIDAMAQLACMSRAQFTRHFRRVTGFSFLEYLTILRLERAKVLLRDTNWSVELVAHAVGLRPAHLWNLFTKRLHTTPSEFRRSVVGNNQSQKKKKSKNSLMNEPKRELNR